jgi:hypothetical protein
MGLGMPTGRPADGKRERSENRLPLEFTLS